MKKTTLFQAGIFTLMLWAMFIIMASGCSQKVNITVKNVNIGTDIKDDSTAKIEPAPQAPVDVLKADKSQRIVRPDNVELDQYENCMYYSVGTWAVDRDCLWNISLKEWIYNDPMMWIIIWDANRDKIKNPDLIYPGQVLRIPIIER